MPKRSPATRKFWPPWTRFRKSGIRYLKAPSFHRSSRRSRLSESQSSAGVIWSVSMASSFFPGVFGSQRISARPRIAFLAMPCLEPGASPFAAGGRAPGFKRAGSTVVLSAMGRVSHRVPRKLGPRVLVGGGQRHGQQREQSLVAAPIVGVAIANGPAAGALYSGDLLTGICHRRVLPFDLELEGSVQPVKRPLVEPGHGLKGAGLDLPAGSRRMQAPGCHPAERLFYDDALDAGKVRLRLLDRGPVVGDQGRADPVGAGQRRVKDGLALRLAVQPDPVDRAAAVAVVHDGAAGANGGVVAHEERGLIAGVQSGTHGERLVGALG